MTKPLEGQHAIVIGGGSGIGFATARLLARDGAVVTLAGRTEAKLVDAAKVLAEERLTVAYTVADALDGAQVAAAVEAASNDGRLHIAVAVPGNGTISPVLLYDNDQFSVDVDQNVRPVYQLLKYAGQAMVRAGGGSFVAVSSAAAVMSARYLASYSVGKAAVDHLVRVAADELGRLNIRVNAIRPGFTRTAATAEGFASEALKTQFLTNQPISRHGEAEDQAQAIRYLAGPESSWVTGQLLNVDGGNTLRTFIDYGSLLDLPDQGDPRNFS